MAKVYVITSGKGGTGKTTTAVNLGAALNRFNEDVIVVDANITTPNIGLHFGAPIVPVSLNHVLKGDVDLEEAIYEHDSGVKILPCSLSIKNLKDSKVESLKKITEKLKKITEHVILDSAAGLSDEVRYAIDSSDEVIIVTNPNTLSVTDSLKAIRLAEELGKSVKGIILTRVKNKKTEMSISDIQEMLEVPILGIVPEDSSIDEALLKKNAVIHTKPKSKASKAYQDITAKILGKQKKQKSFFSRFLSSLRFK